MKPKSTKYLTQWIYDVYETKFLFWSIMAGFITIFPIIYILGLNHKVFAHIWISWQWGIVFVEALLFFLGAAFFTSFAGSAFGCAEILVDRLVGSVGSAGFARGAISVG